MARITQEDCLPHVKNRFDLVLKAAIRARDLELEDADPVVSVDRDKPTVIALREIAAGIDYTKAVVVDREAADLDMVAKAAMDIDQQLKEQLSSETMVDTELLAALNGISEDDLDLNDTDSDLNDTDSGSQADEDDQTNHSSDG